MKRLFLTSTMLFAMSAAAFGQTGDVSIVFSPSTEVYPPGADTATCELYGTAPCVDFSGTITDTDSDGSFLFLTGVTVSAYANFFTVDNTFSDDISIPGGYEGDTLDSPFPNTYTGIIMGLDIAPGTPVGTYSANAVFAGYGGDGDPNGAGFTVDAPFTVIVNAPEPVTSSLVLGGLLAIVAARRRSRPRAC
jgi:hypothetical protein